MFEHGETLKTINIDIVNDHMFEKDETFMIELLDFQSPGAKFGRLKRTVVTIVSDDGMPGHMLVIIFLLIFNSFKSGSIFSFVICVCFSILL